MKGILEISRVHAPGGLWVSLDFIPHCSEPKSKIKSGAKGDSNPRPLAPEARIMPLDQAASWKRAALSSHQFLLLWFRFCFQIGF